MVCDFQVRSLEAQGLPSKQAEAITGAITEVLNDSLGVVSQLVVSKGEMQKVSFCYDKALLIHQYQRVKTQLKSLSYFILLASNRLK